MNQMKPSDYFREFRQGDVSMERWDPTSGTGDRLREALDFLYYQAQGMAIAEMQASSLLTEACHGSRK
ncbi:MAG: hypothetical protein QM749_04795 [Aquabacterium sp.]